MLRLGLPGLAIICFSLLSPALGAAIWTGVDQQQRPGSADTAWFRVDRASLRARLAYVPHEVLLDRSVTIDLPMPDGGLQRFSIVDSPILPAGFESRFPDMKSYKLHGIDDAAASGRADVTHRGFRAMLQTSKGLVFIEPEPGSSQVYKSFYRGGARQQAFACGVHGSDADPLARVSPPARPRNRLAGNYQTYRIAVAATSEYVSAVGGDNAARAEIMTAINRVNQIYETDLGIRLLLVENDGDLLEDSDDECFSNNDPEAMLSENQVWIDARIGSSAYDVGHVFSTFNGGVAFLGAACQNGGKAGGVSGLPSPLGDPFYVDLVAHEIGHQLSAAHTFNGTTGSCGAGNRNAATAFEPGSGSSVMSYAGICNGENLQSNSDAMFHAVSIGQIDSFTAAGGSCRGTIANGNTDPTLTPLADFTIPAQTPFRLQAAAADADPDTLEYQWDQMDSGDATTNLTFGTDLGNNALFRSYDRQTDAWRDFPALGTQLLGLTDKAEVLPAAGRALDFRVTVFDNRSGQDSDDFRLIAVAGPGFRITSDGSSAGGTLDTTAPYTITWDTANTENAPVSCASVDIDLLTFSNATYDRYSIHTIEAGLPNTGSAAIATTLANSHPRARIRVMCSNNVFYDISDADLVIVGTDPAAFDDSANATFFNSGGLTVSRSPDGAKSGVEQSGGTVVGLFSGRDALSAARIDECGAVLPLGNDATAADPRWLLALLAVAGILRLSRRYGLQ